MSLKRLSLASVSVKYIFREWLEAGIAGELVSDTANNSKLYAAEQLCFGLVDIIVSLSSFIKDLVVSN